MSKNPRRKPISNQSPGTQTLFEKLGEGLLTASAQKNLNSYEPHEKQLQFHTSPKPEKLFIGGNRSGKTVGGAIEAIWWLTKTHPYRELPRGPIRGRIVTVDFVEGLEQIILPAIKQWLPKSFLIDGSWEKSYSKNLRVLTLANGSTVDFLSYEQDVEKHAGTSRHFVWFDEEPPYEIYIENMLRLLDTDGCYWITMTPLLGMTWVYENIYEKRDDPEESEHIEVIEVNTKDNPHIRNKARSRIMRRLSNEERDAREAGQFVEMGGLVFKNFEPSRHVIHDNELGLIGSVPPKSWEWYMSLDSGWNNPTAIYWHAVSHEGYIITFAEHYKSEMTVAEHAQVIQQREAQWGKRADLRTGDPAIKQTREATGTSIQQEYASHGIYLSLENVPSGPGSVEVGIARMQAYMNPPPTASNEKPEPQWYIHDSCVNLIRELKRLRWQTYQSKKLGSRLNPQEKVAKKDDHGFDSCRYFFTLMPDLGPLSPMTAKREVALGNGIMRYDEMLVRMSQSASVKQDEGLIDLTASEGETVWYTEPVG